MTVAPKIQRIRFSINLANQQAGWVYCYVLVDKVKHKLAASNVTPSKPFADLVNFLDAIVAGKLPAYFVWDEEGRYKYLRASRKSKSTVRFLVLRTHDYRRKPKPDELLIDGVFDKRQFVSAFYKMLRKFSQQVPNAQDEWSLITEQLDALKAQLDKATF